MSLAHFFPKREEGKTNEKSEEKDRVRGTEDETFYLDVLIGDEEQKKRKGFEAQRVKPPT